MVPAQASASGSSVLRHVARVFGPLSRPLAGRRWFPLWGVVLHEGRRSGRAYATPLVTRRTADGFVIPIPFGESTQWVKNVLASGWCTIRWSGAEFKVADPRIVDRETASPAFGRIQRAMMRLVRLDRFLRLTDRPDI